MEKVGGKRAHRIIRNELINYPIVELSATKRRKGSLTIIIILGAPLKPAMGTNNAVIREPSGSLSITKAGVMTDV